MSAAAVPGPSAALDRARAVADAVLYEGYLLYPYRADSGKNRSRWQFGVLGPPGALEAGTGEDAGLASSFLVRAGPATTVTVRVRFLQLQRRCVQVVDPDGTAHDVAELELDGRRWLTWDEAIEQEIVLGPWPVDPASGGQEAEFAVPGGNDVETLPHAFGGPSGRVVRRRRPLAGRVSVAVERCGPERVRLSVRLDNRAEAAEAADRGSALAASMIGSHLLLAVEDGEFLSMTDPPADARDAAAGCHQHRCWPVLAGPDDDASLMLVSPIILYDHPEIAEQSAGALFDSTEIDEILTLRVMTLTDEERATARATDPRAAEIIDRCVAMPEQTLQQLHGVLRDLDLGPSSGFDHDRPDDDERPWWDPAADSAVSPATDSTLIAGVAVSAGSHVRIHPSRRADAQDLFFAGRVARVAAVHSDVDGQTHVAVVLLDDPAAELHDWYGRYLYFAPDELEPVPADPRATESSAREKGSRS